MLPAILLFSILHFNSEVLGSFLSGLNFSASQTEKLIYRLTPIKASLFFIAVFYLLWLVRRAFSELIIKINFRFFLPPLIALLLLQLAFWNFSPLSMGYGYAEMSVHPFDMPTTWYYKRLLMPALAYATGMRDIHLYFVFSCVVTYSFMLLLWVAVEKLISESSQYIKFLVFVSLCSLECVSFLFFFPGYVDSLLSILILSVYVFPFSHQAKIVLLVLALLTHEISLFICMPYLLFQCKAGERKTGLLIMICYCVLYMTAFQFNLKNLLAVHLVSGLTSIQWIGKDIMLFCCGLLASFKLLWIFFFFGIRYGDNKDKKIIVSIILTCFTCALMGVDTSRLMAFAFPALLISLPYVVKKMPKQLLIVLLVITLLLPHISVTLNMGVLHTIYFKDFFEALKTAL